MILRTKRISSFPIACLVALLLNSSSWAQFGFSNDSFSRKTPLFGSNVNQSGDNSNATAELNEPRHGGFGTPNASVWYSWRPPQRGTASIRVNSSGFGTSHVAAVYQGTSLFSLTQVTSASGFGGSTFDVQANQTYPIAVDSGSSGFGQAATGRFTLSISLAPAPLPPPNDDFASRRRILSTLPVQLSSTIAGATLENAEPRHAPIGISGGSSVWFEWQALETETVEISVLGGPFLPSIAVYTGNSLRTLRRVSTETEFFSETLLAVKSIRYLIAVDSRDDRTGPFSLNIRIPTSYERWLKRFPSLPPGLSAPMQDPDHDTLSNVIEMLLGSDPLVSGDGPTLSIHNDGVFFDYSHDVESIKGPLPPRLIVERSSDLEKWTFASPESLPNHQFQIRLTDGTAGSSRQFVRLRAEIPSE